MPTAHGIGKNDTWATATNTAHAARSSTRFYGIPLHLNAMERAHDGVIPNSHGIPRPVGSRETILELIAPDRSDDPTETLALGGVGQAEDHGRPPCLRPYRFGCEVQAWNDVRSAEVVRPRSTSSIAREGDRRPSSLAQSTRCPSSGRTGGQVEGLRRSGSMPRDVWAWDWIVGEVSRSSRRGIATPTCGCDSQLDKRREIGQLGRRRRQPSIRGEKLGTVLEGGSSVGDLGPSAGVIKPGAIIPEIMAAEAWCCPAAGGRGEPKVKWER